MTGKLIIIEGVDGTGKTTLIQGLVQRIWPDYVFNFKYPEETSPKENMAFAKGEYSASIKIFKKLMEQGKTIICDRFHVGEFAYGPVMRHSSEKEAEVNFMRIENELKELGREVYLIVLAFRDPLNSLKRGKKPGEYLTSISDISAVNARYGLAIQRTSLELYWAMVDSAIEGHPELLLDSVLKFIGGSGVVHL